MPTIALDSLVDIYDDALAAAPAGQPGATTYAQAVIDERIPSGQFVIQAAERHLRDLAEGGHRDLRFDDDTAAEGVAFFGQLPQTKGEWAGKPLTLSLPQQFVIGSLFGWQRHDDAYGWLRRFGASYLEEPRKQGKTTLAAGVGLKLGFFDGEPGAEVYCAATKRDQAKLVWEEARNMIANSTSLKARLKYLDSTATITMERNRSKMQAISAEAKTADGYNPNVVINDELHAHAKRELIDKLDEAMGARRQPLRFDITTAGWDKNSVCWEQHDYGRRVLEGVIEDDSFFPLIYAIDDEETEWQEPRGLLKANPHLGITVKMEDLLRRMQRAIEIPGRQNSFKRQRCGVWTEQESIWLDIRMWDRAKPRRPLDDLLGEKCWAGLDLSTTKDVTALALVFPHPDGGVDVVMHFWCPLETARARANRDRVPYEDWVRDGFMHGTEGNVVDYAAVRKQINVLGEMYDIQEIAIDRWNSTQTQQELTGDGFTVVPFGQGFASMTSPTKKLEEFVLTNTLRHGDDPVLRWMARNVVTEQDAAGNLKPTKDKSTEKIDGITATVMAIGRWEDSPQPGPSMYESSGVRSL